MTAILAVNRAPVGSRMRMCCCELMAVVVVILLCVYQGCCGSQNGHQSAHACRVCWLQG